MFTPLKLVGPNKRYLSPGKCIYCSDSSAPRTKEHILPFALAGNWLIFEDACCRACQAKILEFEQPTLKGSFDHVRYKVGAPSRANKKGKQRRQNKKDPAVQMGYIKGEQIYITRQQNLSPVDYPIGFVGLRLKPPRILQGVTVLSDDRVDGFGQLNTECIKEISDKDNSIVCIASINPLFFARFLAKVAFGYAYGELGVTFVPIIRALVLGKQGVFTDLVGGDYDISPASPSVYELQLFTYDVGLTKFQCVRIRLFAEQGTPNYHVVVGFISNGVKNDYENFLEEHYVHSVGLSGDVHE